MASISEDQYTNVVVIDNGTGFSKLGYAGNLKPNYIIPTTLSIANESLSKKKLPELDFYIGDEAREHNIAPYTICSPMSHGMVEDWDAMEKYWQHCIYKYLQCDPEDHIFLMTEPPLNPPENREYLAEIMFETFNCAGMSIQVQAALALEAGKMSKLAIKKGLDQTNTGLVIDSGDGVTHIIPVVDGYVISSSIFNIPLAGREITAFIKELQLHREGSCVPRHLTQKVARATKEYCYVVSDIAKEFNKYDMDINKNQEILTGINPTTNKEWKMNVFYEKFLAPELFFNPQIFSSSFTTPLPKLIDDCIQSCPLDDRRALYRNITLSGGSTLFKNFGRRLERDVRAIVDARLARSAELSGTTPKPIEVNVISHKQQRYAVWYGGSIVGMHDQFKSTAHLKKEYDEYGTSIFRQNVAFNVI